MNLTCYLKKSVAVRSITQLTPGCFPRYRVELCDGGDAYITHVPTKWLGQLLGRGEGSLPHAYIAATQWTPPGLVQQRIDEGLAFARHWHANR
jgi:hypothetical protein